MTRSAFRSGHAHLTALWREAPTPTRGAALADALVKASDFAAARALLGEATERFPDSLPLALVRARLAHAIGDRVALTRALTEALALDSTHPLAIEMAATHCPALLDRGVDSSETLAFADGDVAELPSTEVSAGAALVSESLADLYRRQGHLEEARQAYAELLARDPENSSLAARYSAVQEEIAAARPLPYDARESGGTRVADWLAALAQSAPVNRPAGPAGALSFDAFYGPPPAPPSATTDFDAFDRWLKDLAP